MMMSLYYLVPFYSNFISYIHGVYTVKQKQKSKIVILYIYVYYILCAGVWTFYYVVITDSMLHFLVYTILLQDVFLYLKSVG